MPSQHKRPVLRSHRTSALIRAGHKKAAQLAAFMFSGTTSVAVWVGKPSVARRPAGDEGAGGSARNSGVIDVGDHVFVAGGQSVPNDGALRRGGVDLPPTAVIAARVDESALSTGHDEDASPCLGALSCRRLFCEVCHE